MEHRAVSSRSGLLVRLATIGADDADPRDEALRKEILVLGSVLTTTLAFVWVGTYWALGLHVSAVIPAVYQVASIVNLVVFARTRRAGFFIACDRTLSLLLPFILQLSLGGFVPSSGVVLWSFSAPLGALLIAGRRGALPWFAGFAAVVGVSGALDPFLTNQPAIPRSIVILFFVLNFLGVLGSSYAMLQYFVRERERYAAALEAERERSERLLLNILPEHIAARLKSGETQIADARAEVGVLFADIAGFTPMTETMEPREVVRLLDDMFCTFDAMAAKYRLEKIKTVGDAYMVASGITGDDRSHAERLADMAIAMLAEVERRDDLPTLRIGIDIGPVVAGVIGRSKFSYDLWGDTVNTASRMESHGVVGAIHVTRRARDRLEPAFRFADRGTIDVKGKGEMTTSFLLGRSTEPQADRTSTVSPGARHGTSAMR